LPRNQRSVSAPRGFYNANHRIRTESKAMSAVSIPRRSVVPRAKTFVLVAMCLAVLMAQLDTSVVNLAAKSIGADFHSGTATLQWVIDAYNLLYASMLLTAGALGDLYGRRRVFIVGIGVFTLGSLLCGMAPNEILLVGGRGITGIGAALMLPTSLSILAVTYPDQKERSHAIALWASCNGLAFAIGPTLGGWIVESIGWRAIFLMIVPVSALTLVLALKFLGESSNPEGRHLDLRGQLLAIAALAGITFAAIEGARLGLTSMPVLVAGGIGCAATAGFLLVLRPFSPCGIAGLHVGGGADDLRHVCDVLPDGAVFPKSARRLGLPHRDRAVADVADLLPGLPVGRKIIGSLRAQRGDERGHGLHGHRAVYASPARAADQPHRH
jgi:MFS family permease